MGKTCFFGWVTIALCGCGCAGSDGGSNGARCGNGVRDDGEGCDLGQANADTGACKSDCTPQRCGDGFVGPGEGCDPGADPSCGPNCAAATCGDGVVQDGEACDDGNDVPDDACTDTCTVPECGDGVVQGDEDCDDGNPDETDVCLADCVDASCGDGLVQAGVEDCDDGNDANEDACISSCEDARCGDGYVQAGVEDCDDRNFSDTDDCLSTCEAARCGDGNVQAGVEACDDGVNDGTYDGCAPGCAALGPHCGDVVVNGTEACDDGNADEEDGCAADCTIAPDVLWTRTWGNVDTQAGYAVATDADGNAFVAGTAEGATDYDVFVGKWDPDGTVQWTRTVDGAAFEAWDDAFGIAIDAAGNAIVAGRIDAVYDDFTGEISGGSIWIRAYDTDGAVLWTRTEAEVGIGYGIAIAPDGTFVVVGAVEVGADEDIWIRKYDAAHAPLWTRTLDGGGGDFDYAEGVAIDADGNVFVSGGVHAGAATYDGWLRKLDPDGATLWTRTHDAAGESDGTYSVAADTDGSVVVTGYESPDGVETTTWIERFDADGTSVWSDTFDGDYGGLDYGLSVALDGDGEIVVAGIEETGDLNYDVWVRKYDADGNVIWTNVYDEAGFDDAAFGTKFDPSGNVFVTGYVQVDSGDYDVWLRKYGS